MIKLPTSKIVISVAGLMAFVVLAAGSLDTENNPSAELPPAIQAKRAQTNPESASTPEYHDKLVKSSHAYKLATIDNGYVDANDRSVKRIRNLLNQLDSKFVENKQQISDMTVRAKQLLEDAGITDTCESIMESVNRYLSRSLLDNKGKNHQKYAEYVALYVTNKKSGH